MSTERTLPKSTITERRKEGSVGMKYQPLELIGSGGSAIAFSAAVQDVNGKPTTIHNLRVRARSTKKK